MVILVTASQTSPQAMQQDDDKNESESHNQLAGCLRKYLRKTASPIPEIAKSLHVSPKTALKHLHACAESCFAAQKANFSEVMRQCKMLQEVGLLEAVLFVEHNMYDETPLKVRLSFEATSAPTSQLGKVIVVMSSWSLLLKANTNHEHAASLPPWLLIRGHYGPSLRAADSLSGQALAAVLSSCPKADPAELPPCRMRLRAIETDEAPANLRCERLWAHAHKNDDFTLCHIMCAAHKCHSAAERTTNMAKSAISGIIRATLCLQGAQDLSKMQSAIREEAQKRCIVLPRGACTLTDAAVKYRRAVMEAFLPGPEYPRKMAICLRVFISVFNGDWRTSAEQTD